MPAHNKHLRPTFSKHNHKHRQLHRIACYRWQFAQCKANLSRQNIDDIIDDVFNTTGMFLAKKSVPVGNNDGFVNGDLLIKTVEPRFLPEGSLKKSLYDEGPVEDIGPDLGLVIFDRYMAMKKQWPEEVASKVERSIILHCIDQNWTKHIDTMARLREAIYLRSYGNVNPLQDYVNEGYELFRDCLELASVDAVLNLVNVKIEPRAVEQEEIKDAPKVDKEGAIPNGQKEKPELEDKSAVK